jgi:anti-sigma factor RsiW
MVIRPFACDRAREWLSLQLDGELSELERTLVRAHLKRCDECRLFGADLDASTAVLRAVPLELLSHPVVVPHTRRIPLRAFRVAAPLAAGIAAAFVLGLSVAGSGAPSLERVGPVFQEPEIAFDADARGLPRATARPGQVVPATTPRSRRLALDV